MSLKYEICDGATRTGVICKVDVPEGLPWRKVWCYYQPDAYVVGAETDLVFLRRGSEVLILPALRMPSAACRFGLATSAQAMINSPVWPTTSTPVGSLRAALPFAMFLKPADTYGYNHYFITPFSVPAQCDEIRIVTNNPAAPTWALLQCLSTSAQLF